MCKVHWYEALILKCLFNFYPKHIFILFLKFLGWMTLCLANNKLYHFTLCLEFSTFRHSVHVCVHGVYACVLLFRQTHVPECVCMSVLGFEIQLFICDL